MVQLKKEKVKDTSDSVAALFKDSPEELKKIRDNEKFIKETEEKPITKEEAEVKVFGASVDINAMLKNNIWNRSIYTVDLLCDTFLGMTIAKLIKYQKKKRRDQFDLFWLLIIIMGIAIAVVIILLVMSGGLGGVF